MKNKRKTCWHTYRKYIIALTYLLVFLLSGIASVKGLSQSSFEPKIIITRTDNLTYEIDKKDFTYQNEIIGVEQPPNMKHAEIWLPKKSSNAPVISTQVLTRQTILAPWAEAKPYCKNKTTIITENRTEPVCNKEDLLKLNCTTKQVVKIVNVLNEITNECYYDVNIINNTYYFKTEHFSDFYVNGTDYNRLIDCMVAKNKTANKCIINTNGFSETFNKSYHTADTLVEIANTYKDIFLDFNNSQHHLGSLRTWGNSENITLRNWHITTQSGFCSPRHYYLTSSNMTLYNMNSTCTTDDDYFSGTTFLNMTKCTFNRTTMHMTNCDNCTIDQTRVIDADIRATAPSGNGIFTVIGDSRGTTIKNSTCVMGDTPWADTESCYYLNCYNCNYTRLYAKGKNRKGIRMNWYFSTLTNSYIEDSTKCIEVGTLNQYSINNTVNNCSQEGIRWNQGAIGNANNGGVHRNRIYNSGNASLLNTETNNISYSPESFGGNCYNTAVQMYNKAYGGAITITVNGTDVSTIINGTNNASLWLCSAGAIRYTLLIEEPQNAGLCAGVCGGAGLNCDYFENNYLVNNGQNNNYTYNNNTICGTGANPAWLAWNNHTKQVTHHYPLLAYASYNNQMNISGNIIQINDGRNHFHDANITQTNMMGGFQIKDIWLNHFRTARPILNGANISLCVNGQGNFYQESQTPNSTDCGIVNITRPTTNQSIRRHDNTLHINWSPQNSITPITYHLWWRTNDTSWQFIGTTQDTNYSWDYTSEMTVNQTTNTSITIRPHDTSVYGTNQTRQIWITKEPAISELLVLWVILMITTCFLYYISKTQLNKIIWATAIFIVTITAIQIQDTIITSFIMYLGLLLFFIEIIRTINILTQKT